MIRRVRLCLMPGFRTESHAGVPWSNHRFRCLLARGVSVTLQHRKQNPLWPGVLLTPFGLMDSRDAHLSWIRLQEMINICPFSKGKCKVESLCFGGLSPVRWQSRWTRGSCWGHPDASLKEQRTQPLRSRMGLTLFISGIPPWDTLRSGHATGHSLWKLTVYF